MEIADVRTDEDYNQNYLDKKDKEFVEGFDYCMDIAVDSFFDNAPDAFQLLGSDYLEKVFSAKLREYLRDEIEVPTTFPGDVKRVKIDTYGELIWEMLRVWVESSRDELIVSMLESYSDEKYEKLKAERNEK